tara:strand:+ start:194 stop:520 length:327 start_codon:yes stop_codon:yes gene_type:complete
MDNYRIGDIEFKREGVEDNCHSLVKPSTLMLVRWTKTQGLSSDGSNYCFTLAFFDKLNGGYNLEAVGDRLLRAIEECPETVLVWRYAEDFLRLEVEAERRKDLFEKSL